MKPGEKISLETETSPNSFVAILGVDQSVTLLGSGNDIDKSRLSTEINSYNVYDSYPELKIEGNDERYKELAKSNAFILTNALNGLKECVIDERTDGDQQSDLNKDDLDDSELEFEKTHKEVKTGVRKNFPETWIFEDFKVDGSGFHSCSFTVPDTITSFIVSGFSVDPKTGLALAAKKKVTVFQDFFIKLYLPYSIRLGEILKVEVNVFNYITRPQQPVDVLVELRNNDAEFVFIDVENKASSCIKTEVKDNNRKKTITIESQSGSSVFFLIKPIVMRQIKLNVIASTSFPKRNDEIEKILLVESEGLTLRGNIVQIYRPTDGNDAKDENIDISNTNVTKNSIYIEASAVGDILGPAIKNIDSLM